MEYINIRFRPSWKFQGVVNEVLAFVLNLENDPDDEIGYIWMAKRKAIVRRIKENIMSIKCPTADEIAYLIRLKKTFFSKLRGPLKIKDLKYLENVSYIHSQMNAYRLKNIAHVKTYGIRKASDGNLEDLPENSSKQQQTKSPSNEKPKESGQDFIK
jgi:hypothetical protein